MKPEEIYGGTPGRFFGETTTGGCREQGIPGTNLRRILGKIPVIELVEIIGLEKNF